jgi:signal peptidase I
MREKGPEPLESELAREFEYPEKPALSPAWQLARDIGETIVLTLLMFLVIRLAVQDYQVQGSSMYPTLHDTQFVLVDKLTYDFSAPQRGDVVVFEFPLNHSENYIKRIIGIPGDTVSITADGHVSVNGVLLNEPYVNDLDNEYGPETVALGPNQYFVLGDNRGNSSDSRDWGVVKRSEIIGKATLVYWPLSAMHFLPNEHSIFSSVPAGQLNSAGSNIPLGRASSLPVTPFDSPLLVPLLPVSAGLVATGRRIVRARQRSAARR